MDRKADIRRALDETREKTLWLLDQVPHEFLRRRVHGFYSPIGWHFGHIGRTEEFWVLKEALRRECLSDEMSFIFADLPENPKSNRVNIPEKQGIVRYLSETRKRAMDALEEADLSDERPLLNDGYAWEFALQHECQHQETIVELMQLIQRQIPQTQPESYPEWSSSMTNDWVAIPGGKFVMGTDDLHAYDNERPRHVVEAGPFSLKRLPVTAYLWSQFIEDGGYRGRTLWSEEGWAWRCGEEVEAPEHWVRGAGWGFCGPFGLRALLPDEAVCGISWFEAEAFSRWAGGRLPTEQEWEYATVGSTSRRFPWGDEWPSRTTARFGMEGWGPGQAGQHRCGSSPFGVEDMAGGVWEWTASPFEPYPGYVPFPYEGYSKAHMDGRHFVCRGGSWASAATILRRTFRNWYVPSYRQGLLGMRLASQ